MTDSSQSSVVDFDSINPTVFPSTRARIPKGASAALDGLGVHSNPVLCFSVAFAPSPGLFTRGSMRVLEI